MKKRKSFLALIMAIILLSVIFSKPVYAHHYFCEGNYDYYVLNEEPVLEKRNDYAVIDYSNSSNGYVTIKWLSEITKRIAVRITDPEERVYTYYINQNEEYETFPLTGGDGLYTVKVLRETDIKNRFAVMLSLKLDVKLVSELEPFIRANQYVNYNESMEAIKLAEKLVSECKNDGEKVKVIYQYVIRNLEYDKQKAADITGGLIKGYFPNIDDVLNARKGICFDYASLMAAMLRSQDIPVKLITGYIDERYYHAWVEVWNGEGWQRYDPTLASENKGEAITRFILNDENYKIRFIY